MAWEFVNVDFQSNKAVRGMSKKDAKKIRTQAARAQGPRTSRQTYDITKSLITLGESISQTPLPSQLAEWPPDYSSSSSSRVGSDSPSPSPSQWMVDDIPLDDFVCMNSKLLPSMSWTNGPMVEGLVTATADEEEAEEVSNEDISTRDNVEGVTELDAVYTSDHVAILKREEHDQFRRAIGRQFLTSLCKNNVDPFWTLALPRDQPWLSLAIHFALNDLCPVIPGLDSEGQNGMFAGMVFHMDNPGFALNMALMGASGEREKQLQWGVHQNPKYAISESHISWLRFHCISAINENLSVLEAGRGEVDKDLFNATFNATISLANWEATYGDPSLYAIHLKGAKLLMRRCGGFEALNTFTQRWLRWQKRGMEQFLASHQDSIYHKFGLPWQKMCDLILE